MAENKNFSTIESIRDALNNAIQFLSSRDIESPRLNAERLLCHVLDVDSSFALYLEPDSILSQNELDSYHYLLNKRIKGIPLQYIVGKTEFMSLPFKVESPILIPRPETEILVETVLDRFKGKESRLLLAADTGTGAGNIAVSLARYIHGIHIYATDIFLPSLRLARYNSRLNDTAFKITFLHGDLFDPFKRYDLQNKFDLIISNPPYVRRSDIPHLLAEIRNHESHRAIDGGYDGLDFYRRLIPQSLEYLKSGGILALEIGLGQSESVFQIIRDLKVVRPLRAFTPPKIVKDFNGIDRVVLAHKI